MTDADRARSDPEFEEDFGDIPQEFTESYGTGVHEQPGYTIGGRSLRARRAAYHATDPSLTGGDVDAAWEQADRVGDEAVGGTVATPDQNIVEELAAAVGLEIDDYTFLRTNDLLSERDTHRWDLDPQSAEDYEERHDEGDF